ncbi:hypothetical protein ACJBPP_11065, partial [Streptococcus suis]
CNEWDNGMAFPTEHRPTQVLFFSDSIYYVTGARMIEIILSLRYFWSSQEDQQVQSSMLNAPLK